MATTARKPAIDWSGLLSRHGVLLAAILAMAVPTLLSLATGPWTTEAGVQGPIVLATGSWLLLRRATGMGFLLLGLIAAVSALGLL